MSTDHPTITAWLQNCYKRGPGGLIVVPYAATLQLQNGKRYLVPQPGGELLDHLRRNGDDEDGRPLYCST